MSKMDETEIRRQLEAISQIEPGQEATERAVARARDVVLRNEKAHKRLMPRIWQLIAKGATAKLAAAAVLMVGLGYLAGRLSAAGAPDVEEIRSVVESSMAARLDEALESKIEEITGAERASSLDARFAELREGLGEQLRRDVKEAAVQTLAAAGSLTDRRLTELAEQFEAARLADRQSVGEVLREMELNRRYDKDQLRNGLRSLVAYAVEAPAGRPD
ncbi:MAG: hypothetical protein JSU94_20800 [Phycisphaerales bacterium]|nr:MAG: hypothetical protein JSU94_20800 [Phycisphaerales bacterium]